MKPALLIVDSIQAIYTENGSQRGRDDQPGPRLCGAAAAHGQAVATSLSSWSAT